MLKNAIKSLTKFEIFLWLFSLVSVTLAFIIPNEKNPLNYIASLIGVSALIFVSKGQVLGQVLTLVFSVFYGVVSYKFRYYGEMITYCFMTAPIALLSIISWAKNPFDESKVVKVNNLGATQIIIMLSLSAAVTVAFYFILSALDTPNIVFSTISVLTSFLASYLTFMRSPYYAICYAANDAVLIVLWVLAAIENPSYIPMIVNFFMFFINDSYGFFNWKKLKKSQNEKDG